EGDTADVGEEINAARRQTDLVDGPDSCQILDLHPVRSERRTESHQRSVHLGRVIWRCTYEDVEVSGCPGHTVGGQGMSANDHEFRLHTFERADDIDEVRVHYRPARRRHGVALRRMTRP